MGLWGPTSWDGFPFEIVDVGGGFGALPGLNCPSRFVVGLIDLILLFCTPLFLVFVVVATFLAPVVESSATAAFFARALSLLLLSFALAVALAMASAKWHFFGGISSAAAAAVDAVLSWSPR